MTIQRPRQSVGALLAALLALLSVFPSASFAQAPAARPVDPITGIVDAFKTHDVVALGEGNHGNEQGAVFREKLYRDPRFQAAVNDIVVEAGNGRHQAMMDRYIAGENVPEKELRMAWIETTQPHDVWDRDIYADMFRTIREINQKLPKAKQLRVLLGDTPFDSSAPPGPMNRLDSFTAELIQRETIAKKRKALVVYGGMHFLRRQAQLPPEASALRQPGTIVSLLEKAGVKVFHIWTFVGIGAGQELTALQPEIASWPKPSLALIKDTTLGVAPFTFYYPKGSGRMTYRGPEGTPVTIDIGEAIGGTMQDQADAILYLAPRSEITYAKLSASLCADPDYIEMRVKRMTAMAPPGASPGGSPGDAFRMRCNAVVKGPRNTPTPGLEALARRIMESDAKGQPALDIMSPGLANAAQNQRDGLMKAYARSGPLQSLTFQGATSDGVGDTYLAVFGYNSRTISIMPGPDGKISGFLLGPFLPQTDAQLKASFKAIDLNADGELDKPEYKTMLTTIGYPEMFDSLFTQIDDDKDGVLTAKEYEAHPQQ